MPALQVRDFPDDLYEQLKAYAASQHRSIAQQTIVAVEQMLEAADAQHYWDGHDLHRLERRPRYFDFDTEAKRAVRIEKRKELFAEIDKLPKFDVPDDFPKRYNRLVRHIFCKFRRKIFIFFNHVLLHQRIFLIINVISPLPDHKAIFKEEESFFFFCRFHKHKHFFTAKIPKMDSG